MSRYFTYLPKITYNGKEAVNIAAKANILDTIRNNTIAFLNYTIKEGERAEDIAYYYYEDIGKVWLVYLANNIVDPYSQWPLSNVDLERMIISKYETLSGTSGIPVLAWTQANVIHYKNITNPNILISPDTYNLNGDLGIINSADWSAVSYYDYEINANETKRSIFLVNRIYADQMETELESIMNV